VPGPNLQLINSPVTRKSTLTGVAVGVNAGTDVGIIVVVGAAVGIGVATEQAVSKIVIIPVNRERHFIISSLEI
jgi:hypothetical protein